ncbi:lymphocyte antigen-6, epidermis [Simochromis diagramma]|uniref:lymphocyte antigen-6, epidermis n=1 Tax=Simochromis diagramma TaxID=43689 RepID=UPI001A7E5D0D|nr:lymphocyte antigen-6, epidermis [Simochromis diagramma]
MMNNFWKATIVLGAFIAAAQCLTCRQCPIGIFGTCFLSKDVTCTNTNQSCFRGDALFSAAGGLKLHTRGCLESDLCGTSLNGSILSVAYSTSFQCCNTDVCNGATSIQLPLTVALFAALLASLWSFWEM